MSKSLGTLTLDLVARTGGFVKGMNKAERESKKWRRQVERDLKKLGTQFVRFAKVSAAAGVAAAGAFTLLAKQGLEYVDAQAKMARQVGATIDGLRGLQIAANDAGINTNTLNGAVDRLNARLGEARQGSGQAYEALTRLGLSADALARMDADQRIATIADRVRELGLDSADTADLLRNLGIRNREMVNLIMAGGDGIRAARQEVDDYGLSLSEIDARAVEQANDQLSRIPRVLEPIRNQIAINLAEPLTDVANLFNDAAKESGGFADVVLSTMESAALAVAGLIDKLQGVQKLFLQVKEIDLNFQAALEMGQNALTPGEQATPAMDALNDVRQSLARIESGETVASSVRDYFAGLGEGGFREAAERRERLQAGVDAGLGGAVANDAIAAAVSVSESFDTVAEAATDAASAMASFNPSANSAVDDIISRAGDGATIDAKGMIRDAWGNTLPSLQRELDAELKAQVQDFQNKQNLSAGLQAAAQSFLDGASSAVKGAWASITPQSADGFASGGVMPTGEQQSGGWSSIKPQTPEQVASGVTKVQGTATAATSQSGGGGRELGTLRLASEAGGEIDVQGASDELTRWLADTLGGVSAGVSSA